MIEAGRVTCLLGLQRYRRMCNSPVFDVLRKERPPVGGGSSIPDGSASIGISVVDMGFFFNHAMILQ